MNMRSNFKEAAKNVLRNITFFLPTAALHAVTQRAYDNLFLDVDIPFPEEWSGPQV